jgi:hypothetical protein
MKTDPIFIVEDNCSGSNYLATLIAKHPDIGIAPESNFILDLMYHFRNRVLKSQKDIDEALAVIFQSKTSTHKSEVDFSAFGINSTQLKSFLNSALPATVPDIVNFILSQYCRKHFPGCSTWGVKKGCYVFELDKLVRYFPRAKFIHIVRDGRAVYAAQKRSLLNPTGEPLEPDPILAAKRWKVFNFLEVPDIDISSGAKLPPQGGGPSTIEYPDKTILPQLDSWQKELTPLEIYLYETVAGHHLKYKNYALIAEKNMQRPMLQTDSAKQWATPPKPSRPKFSFLRSIKLARNRLI